MSKPEKSFLSGSKTGADSTSIAFREGVSVNPSR